MTISYEIWNHPNNGPFYITDRLVENGCKKMIICIFNTRPNGCMYDHINVDAKIINEYVQKKLDEWGEKTGRSDLKEVNWGIYKNLKVLYYPVPLEEVEFFDAIPLRFIIESMGFPFVGHPPRN